MKHKFLHRALIIIPSILLGAVIVYSLSIMIPLYAYLLPQSIGRFLTTSASRPYTNKTIRPHIPQTSPDTLFTKINQYRLGQELTALTLDTTTCTAASPTGLNDSIFGICANCTHAVMLSITKYAYPNHILDRLTQEETASKTLLDSNLTHLCIGENDQTLSLVFPARQASQLLLNPASSLPGPKPSPPNSPKANSGRPSLSTAVLRQTTLNQSDSLCTYARKRVTDHINLMSEKSADEYPVPEKYPLDAHAGFSADAQSGSAFDIAGKNELAENLGLLPRRPKPRPHYRMGLGFINRRSPRSPTFKRLDPRLHLRRPRFLRGHFW
jgi:hypothetical protein